MAAEYWVEATRFAGLPEPRQLLVYCGLTLVRTGPSYTVPGTEITTDFWLVSDPAAASWLQDKTVELTIEPYMKNMTPDFGDGPTMDVIYYPQVAYRIKERKVR